MLPTQYATNIRALTVLFLVNPATFELIILSDKGMLAAKTAPKQRPVILPARFSSSNFQIRIMPIIETVVFKIIMKIRLERTRVAKPEVRRRNVSWAAPMGI